MVRADGKAYSVEAKHKMGGRSPHGSPVAGIPTPSRSSSKRESNGDKARGAANALEEIMRRRGVDEAWNELENMQKQGVVTDKYTVSRMLMKSVGDGRSRPVTSRVYRGMDLVEKFIDLQPKDVDEVLFNALLDTCGRLKDLTRLEATVNKMKELNVTPSPVTLGILVKTYGQAGDLPKVLQVWEEMHVQRELANAVTYGCMIDACVKCGSLQKAVDIFTAMRAAGKHKNTILYTTLIKGYGLEKDLQSALELFREMPNEGVPYNTITYNSILDACVKSGDLTTAESLLREMMANENSLEPDLITFSTLLKGYCHINELDKALQVAESIKARGLRCDELVYNTLMDGCVKAGDVTAGLGLFEEMVHSGLKPSAITHSILARLYQRAGYDEGATEAVAQLYLSHGLERPSTDRNIRRGNSKNWNRSPGGGSNRSAHGSPMGSPVVELASSVGSPFGGMGDEGRSPVAGGLQLPHEAMRRPAPPLPGQGGYDFSPYNAGYGAVGSPVSGSSACGSVGGSPLGGMAGYGGQQQVAFPAPAPQMPPWPLASSPPPQQQHPFHMQAGPAGPPPAGPPAYPQMQHMAPVAHVGFVPGHEAHGAPHAYHGVPMPGPHDVHNAPGTPAAAMVVQPHPQRQPPFQPPQQAYFESWGAPQQNPYVHQPQQTPCPHSSPGDNQGIELS
eukprot:TRINITY_DN609_c1_g1_i1.p1 TRINITY_DN609_c1_g1~~TRINITY_DN609_c1_g1_i1.p1  ORF type:complete len:677 (+),score=166.92 TRINITY_DN609_c1_g1_i1:65-2095(+)